MVLLKPHLGLLGVPFMNSMTESRLISCLSRSSRLGWPHPLSATDDGNMLWNSPLATNSLIMSRPPTSSPLMYSCGYVGQLEYSFKPASQLKHLWTIPSTFIRYSLADSFNDSFSHSLTCDPFFRSNSRTVFTLTHSLTYQKPTFAHSLFVHSSIHSLMCIAHTTHSIQFSLNWSAFLMHSNAKLHHSIQINSNKPQPSTKTQKLQQTLSHRFIRQNVKRRELCISILENLNQWPAKTWSDKNTHNKWYTVSFSI